MKECEVCKRKTKTVSTSKSDGRTLCIAHRRQLDKYGKIIRVEVKHGRFFPRVNTFKKLKNFATIDIDYKGIYYKVKIDREDFDKCKQYTWCLNANKLISTSKNLILHRFVLDNPKNYSVRHISNDLLDCRKANLKKIPMNKPDVFSNTGISWNSNLKKWCVSIFSGRFTDIKDAEKVRSYMLEKLEEYNKENKEL